MQIAEPILCFNHTGKYTSCYYCLIASLKLNIVILLTLATLEKWNRPCSQLTSHYPIPQNIWTGFITNWKQRTDCLSTVNTNIHTLLWRVYYVPSIRSMFALLFLFGLACNAMLSINNNTKHGVDFQTDKKGNTPTHTQNNKLSRPIFYLLRSSNCVISLNNQ